MKNIFSIETRPRHELLHRIREVDDKAFDKLALDVFRYQATYNSIYAQFLKLLRIDPRSVVQPAEIPCLPISLFKRFKIQSGAWEPQTTFTSSGTSSATTSRHALRDSEWYRANARRAFENQYGAIAGRPILALLPAYLERSGSSLVFMAEDFIKRSGHPASGFFLSDLEGLQKTLVDLRQVESPAPLLIGVSFGLLDLAAAFPENLSHCIIMETGGMKGRRKEMTRGELHAELQAAFGVNQIHSEYGMTELLSQAYAPSVGRFWPAPTLRAYTRDVTDPLTIRSDNRTGALNLHDLANLDTISFIATDDLGRVYPNGSFEVLGRMDASDTRGCNLLVA